MISSACSSSVRLWLAQQGRPRALRQAVRWAFQPVTEVMPARLVLLLVSPKA